MKTALFSFIMMFVAGIAFTSCDKTATCVTDNDSIDTTVVDSDSVCADSLTVDSLVCED